MKSNPCALCCRDMDILPMDLLFPSKMTPEGREFVEAHGLLDLPLSIIMQNARLLDNGMIKIFHQCDQLDENGLCTIYDDRPKICREYRCETRKECTNKLIQVVQSA